MSRRPTKSHVEYWVQSARHDLDVAETLFQAKKYDWCLFISHLVLEKVLNALYAKTTDELPPRMHDLVRLADLAGIKLDDDSLEFLDGVNSFNISVRYPDEKLKFHQTCTHEFTKITFSRIKEIYQWLLRQI